MKSYCLKCRKDTENINPRVSKTSNGRAMVLSKCAICDSKATFTKYKLHLQNELDKTCFQHDMA